MNKNIYPNELAELVVGLLLKPYLLGELDTTDSHKAFIQDIGQVVADHCGGTVHGVTSGGDSVGYMTCRGNAPTLTVGVNDSLPDLYRNIWSLYDLEGWRGCDAAEVGITAEGEQLSEDAIDLFREELRSQLDVTPLL